MEFILWNVSCGVQLGIMKLGMLKFSFLVDLKTLSAFSHLGQNKERVTPTSPTANILVGKLPKLHEIQ